MPPSSSGRLYHLELINFCLVPFKTSSKHATVRNATPDPIISQQIKALFQKFVSLGMFIVFCMAKQATTENSSETNVIVLPPPAPAIVVKNPIKELIAKRSITRNTCSDNTNTEFDVIKLQKGRKYVAKIHPNNKVVNPRRHL